jgi:hypothetical protein
MASAVGSELRISFTKDDKVVVILNFFDELRRVAPVNFSTSRRQ